MKIAKIIAAFLITAGFISINIIQVQAGVTDDELVAEKLAKNMKIEQKGKGLYNIEFRNADIKDIIRFFAYQYGLNIIADKGVEGTVTASLGNITIKEALKQILDSQNYTMVEIGNVIRVKAKPALVKSFHMENISAKDVLENLTSLLSSDGKIVVDEVSNSIMVTDTEENLNLVQNFIENADVKGKQVLIEAKFIETSLGLTKQLGIEWGTTVTVTGAARPHTFPFGSVGKKYALGNENSQAATTESDRTNIAGFPAAEDDAYTFGTLDFSQFQAILRALLTDTSTKIVSSPQVTTLNNKEAEMGVSTEYPLPTYEINSDTGELTVSGYEYKDVGITLKVTPFITNDEYITITIEPNVGAVGSTVSVAGGGFELPIIESKSATTKVTVKDGETIVIGGLISGDKSKTVKKVPLLGNIPLLGKMFTYKSDSDSKTELLIFVTPHIINLEGKKDRDEKKIKELYGEIKDLLYEGKYEQVISKADEILQIRPDEKDAVKIKENAISKLEAKKKEGSLETKKKAEKLKILWKDANQLYARGDYEKARVKYTYILNETPDDKTAVKMLKRCQDKIEGAKNMNVSSLILSGKRALRDEKYTEALELFKRALELNPENKEIQGYIEKISKKKVQTKEVGSSFKVKTDQDRQIQSIWEEANKLYMRGNYESARVKYTDILTLQPDNKSAMEMLNRCEDKISGNKARKISSLLLLGEKAFRKKEYNKALGYFDDVLELDSGNKDAEASVIEINKQLQLKQTAEQIEADLNRAIELYQNKKYMEANIMLKDVLKKDPENAAAKKYVVLCSKAIKKKEDLNVLWKDANRLYTKRDYKLARGKYADILALDAGNKSAMEMLNRCEDKIDIAKSKKVSSLLVLGKKALRRKEYQKALKYFDKALELDPSNKEADRKILEVRKSMERERLKEENGQEMKKTAKPGLGQERKLKILWKDANALYMREEYKTARAKYADILTIEPNDKIAREMLKRCEDNIYQDKNAEISTLLLAGKKELRKKNYQKALGHFEQVLKLEPANKKAKRYIAKINKHLKSVSVEKPAVPKKEKSEANLLFSQAMDKYKNGDYKNAVPLFEQALIINPAHQDAYQYLEKCYQNIDRLKPYEKQISELIQKGKSYIKNREYEKAYQTFGDVLKIDPQNAKAKRYRISLRRRVDKMKQPKIKSPSEEIKAAVPEKELIAGEEKLTSREIKGIYRKALDLYKRKEYKKALAKFKSIAEIESRYQKDSQRKAELCLKKVNELSVVDEKYRRALSCFNRALYEKCIKLLLEVTDLKPNYKESKKYLKLSRERMKVLENLEEYEQVQVNSKK